MGRFCRSQLKPRGEPQSEQVFTADAPKTFEEKRDRYMISERHEVSDGGLWQQWFDANIVAVLGEDQTEAPPLYFRDYLERNARNE